MKFFRNFMNNYNNYNVILGKEATFTPLAIQKCHHSLTPFWNFKNVCKHLHLYNIDNKIIKH